MPLEAPKHEFKEERPYSSFPRHTTPKLEIHTDTCVMLKVRRAQAVITTAPNPWREEEDPEEEPPKILMAIVDDLSLTSIVGLEKTPEIVLFTLSLGTGTVKFGNWDYDLDSIHFNQTPSPDLEVLIRKTEWRERVWAGDTGSKAPFLKLTSKVLFDSKQNLKAINLAFALSEVGIVLRTLQSTPAWIEWLKEFFTVVEYPVEGYIPPALLTEMQFDLACSTLDLTPKCHPARLALALGHANVQMNLLDTGDEMTINIMLEDTCVFMTIDPKEPINYSVCVVFADFLNLDLSKNIAAIQHDDYEKKENGEKNSDVTDTQLGGNIITIRTCVDTLKIMAELIQSMAANADFPETPKGDSTEQNEEVEEENLGASGEFVDEDCPTMTEKSEEMIPDIADAMLELEKNEEREKKKKKTPNKKVEDYESKQALKSQKPGNSSGQAASQVFYFPNESSDHFGARPKTKKASPATELPTSMTDSFYPGATDALDLLQGNADDEFVILDTVGTGVMKQNEETTIKCAKNTMAARENCTSQRRPKRFSRRALKGTRSSTSSEPSNYQLRLPSLIEVDDGSGLKYTPGAGTIKSATHFASRFSVRKLSICWMVYGGNDFSSSRQMAVNTKRQLLGDDLRSRSGSPAMGSRVNHASETLSSSSPMRRTHEDLRSQGGPGRNTDQLLEIYINKIGFEVWTPCFWISFSTFG